MEKHGTDAQHKTEERDGMIVEWDVPIEMDDGVVLRADVFRPSDDDRYPVILSYGAFGKGLAVSGGQPVGLRANDGWLSRNGPRHVE